MNIYKSHNEEEYYDFKILESSIIIKTDKQFLEKSNFEKIYNNVYKYYSFSSTDHLYIFNSKASKKQTRRILRIIKQ